MLGNRHVVAMSIVVGQASGVGAIGAAVAGMLWFGDPAVARRIVPIGLIAVGIVWLALAE